jgi:Fic family protein
MARVRVPKAFAELLQNIPAAEYLALLGKFGATNDEGLYLHWDKFMWRVPKGISEETAWLATKFARKTMLKTLPGLHANKSADRAMACFSYCVPESLFAKLHHIDKCTGGGNSLDDRTFITATEKDRYLVKSLMMEEAITSSQLEGASTTRAVAKEMLETSRTPKDKSEQMIFNNYLLMKKAVEKKDEQLSIDLILDLHQIATFKAIDNDAKPGELRQDNDIDVRNIYNEVAHTPPCYTSLRERLNALCEFANTNHAESANGFIHPVIKAIILHFMIGYIHPFGDGNGRTARALFYWYMLRSGYWLFEFVSISKLIKEKRTDYDTVYIYTETDDFDLTYFIYHQVDVIIKAVDALRDHIATKKSDFYHFIQWVEKSPISKKLKRGQLELLKDALKQPGRVFTAKQVAVEFDITENTARAYLNGLVDVDLLIPTKSKKSKEVGYVSPAGLKQRLQI